MRRDRWREIAAPLGIPWTVKTLLRESNTLCVGLTSEGELRVG